MACAVISSYDATNSARGAVRAAGQLCPLGSAVNGHGTPTGWLLRLTTQPRQQTPSTRSIRRSVPGRRAYLVSRRVNQPATTNMNGRHRFVAARNVANHASRDGIPPDVDLPERKPALTQCPTQPKAVRTAWASVKDHFKGHGPNCRRARCPRTR
jgi:hypothetical protein